MSQPGTPIRIERKRLTCAECKQDKPLHRCFVDDDETEVEVHLYAENTARTWQKEMCYDCWIEFQRRAFVTISRVDREFFATCAF